MFSSSNYVGMCNLKNILLLTVLKLRKAWVFLIILSTSVIFALQAIFLPVTWWAIITGRTLWVTRAVRNRGWSSVSTWDAFFARPRSFWPSDIQLQGQPFPWKKSPSCSPWLTSTLRTAVLLHTMFCRTRCFVAQAVLLHTLFCCTARQNGGKRRKTMGAEPPFGVKPSSSVSNASDSGSKGLGFEARLGPKCFSSGLWRFTHRPSAILLQGRRR